MKTVNVDIKDIIIDGNLYPRVQFTWMKAYQYSLAMKAGAVFPQINLGKYKSQLYLIDGLHRLKANERLKRTIIKAYIKKYTNKKEMFIDAVALNNTHGKALTVMDKALIFAKLQEYNVSNTNISKLLGTPINKFSVYIERLVTLEGKEVPIKSILEKALKRKIITEDDVARIVSAKKQKTYVSRTVKNAFTQLINAIEQGAVPWDDPKILALATQLSILLDRGLDLKDET